MMRVVPFLDGKDAAHESKIESHIRNPFKVKVSAKLPTKFPLATFDNTFLIRVSDPQKYLKILLLTADFAIQCVKDSPHKTFCEHYACTSILLRVLSFTRGHNSFNLNYFIRIFF